MFSCRRAAGSTRQPRPGLRLEIRATRHWARRASRAGWRGRGGGGGGEGGGGGGGVGEREGGGGGVEASRAWRRHDDRDLRPRRMDTRTGGCRPGAVAGGHARRPSADRGDQGRR